MEADFKLLLYCITLNKICNLKQVKIKKPLLGTLSKCLPNYLTTLSIPAQMFAPVIPERWDSVLRIKKTRKSIHPPVHSAAPIALNLLVSWVIKLFNDLLFVVYYDPHMRSYWRCNQKVFAMKSEAVERPPHVLRWTPASPGKLICCINYSNHHPPGERYSIPDIHNKTYSTVHYNFTQYALKYTPQRQNVQKGW